MRSPDDRRRLFEELDGYIRQIMDHMIKYSNWNFDDYQKIRAEMLLFSA